ncbi:MAG: LysR family transcriptional regulator [Pseudomonadota bacterium]|jgi:DNA-binding transcriptional LysR family regulator|nr:LysR family transcriptional regulator [Pseudomonadota bacterium]
MQYVVRLDPRHLSYLLAIHEHGSLSRAAEALGISQPALSNSIAVLERRLGVRVLARTARGAQVNPFGAILVRRSRELRSLLMGAEREIELQLQGHNGPLVIGAIPSIVESLVPHALRRLQQDCSTATITVVEEHDDVIDKALLSGELDIAIAAVGCPEGSLELVEELLLPDPLVLGVGYNSPLAGRALVTLAQAREQPWIVPRPGGSAYAQVHATFLNAGVAWPKNYVSTNSAALTKRLITQSDAVGLVNSLTLLGWEAPIWPVRLAEAGVRNIGVRRRRIRELTPLAERFLELIRQVGLEFANAVKPDALDKRARESLRYATSA